ERWRPGPARRRAGPIRPSRGARGGGAPWITRLRDGPKRADYVTGTARRANPRARFASESEATAGAGAELDLTGGLAGLDVVARVDARAPRGLTRGGGACRVGRSRERWRSTSAAR